MYKRAVAVALAIVAVGVPASAAQESRVLSGPLGQFYGYVTPVVVLESGGSLTYTNVDIVQHDVVHDVSTDGIASKKKQPWCKAFDKGACPLFWSKRVGLGGTTSVKGVQSLPSGEVFTFYCTLHPGMKGKLLVAP